MLPRAERQSSTGPLSTGLSLSLSLRLSVGVACGRGQLCCSVHSLFEPVSHSFSLNMAVVQLVILK